MINLRDLALDAPDGRLLLEGLDLVLPEGANLLVTGPSGCGKSRLLKVIAGAERPLEGGVSVGGVVIWPGAGALALIGKVRVGFAFASGGLLSNLSLWDNLALPLRFRGLILAEIRPRVEAALDRFDLHPVANLRPHAVSASARKHANLARVLACDAELILLDDPLEGLDSGDRVMALNVIRHWAMDPRKTLVITQEETGPWADLAMSRLELQSLAAPLEIP